MTTTQRNKTNHLLSVCVNSFDQLLQTVHSENSAWKRFADDIDRYNLLTVKVPRKVDLTPPVIDQTKLMNREYRLKLATELRKPLPSPFWIKKLPLDRGRLTDNDYRAEIARTLGSAFFARLELGIAPPEVQCSLYQLNAELLAECLHRSPRFNSAMALSQYIMNKLVQEEISNVLGDKLDNAFIDVEERALANLDERFKMIAVNTQQRFAEISRRTNERFDEMQRRIQERGYEH